MVEQSPSTPIGWVPTAACRREVKADQVSSPWEGDVVSRETA